MRTVQIRWQVVEQHSAFFNVPDDFDAGEYDMDEALTDADGGETFDHCERDVREINRVEPDPDAPVLDLEGLRYG